MLAPSHRFENVDQCSHLQRLVQFYAGLWKSVPDKDFLDLVAMVSLKNDRVVLGSPPTSTVCLQLRREIRKVDALPVNPLDYCRGLAPFTHLHTDLNSLLLHTDGAADAEVLRKAARRTNVGHTRGLRLLSLRPHLTIRRAAYLSVPSRWSDTD